MILLTSPILKNFFSSRICIVALYLPQSGACFFPDTPYDVFVKLVDVFAVQGVLPGSIADPESQGFFRRIELSTLEEIKEAHGLHEPFPLPKDDLLNPCTLQASLCDDRKIPVYGGKLRKGFEGPFPRHFFDKNRAVDFKNESTRHIHIKALEHFRGKLPHCTEPLIREADHRCGLFQIPRGSFPSFEVEIP